MADERASTDEKLQGVTKWIMISAVVAYSLLVRRFFLGMVAAGVIWYYMSEQTDEEESTVPEQDSDTAEADSASSLVYGPSGTVQAAVHEGMEDYTAKYVLYATSRRPVTVETERASDPPSHTQALRNFVDILGFGEEMVPGNRYAEPPEKVLHEVRRQVRRDVDAGKVRTENEPRISPSEDTKVKIGLCEVEADKERNGFRYSVSYDSRYFDWEADSIGETDDGSVPR